VRRFLALTTSLALCASAFAQDASVRRNPSVGYLYPAGAQRGTMVHVTAGGQFLAGADAAYVSGEGLTIVAVRHVKPLDNDQRQELRRRIVEIREMRRGGGRDAVARRAAKKENADEKPVELPDLWAFRDLEKTSDKGLDELLSRYFGPDGKRQINAQLADVVEFDVEVDARAAPGVREIRIGTALGLSNPLRFEVSALPEVREEEIGEWRVDASAALATPVVVNGQISPGDVDRFRVKCARGDRLVVSARARNLVPFLADAVPGWFQAAVSLSDAKGREVAFADDYRFDPDPVLFYEVPVEGEYVVQIRDALYRGREDFVYRASVGVLPFVTRVFPLGVRAGDVVEATIDGWNLLKPKIVLDGTPGGDATRFVAAQRDGRPGNLVPYAVGDLPSIDESERGGAAHAQSVALPVIVDGRIARAGEVHAFRFDGRAGDEIVADVEARRLASPLDSVVRIVDPSGAVLAWNDDFDDGAPGILTHHADSRVATKLPADGVYEARIADAQGHGGPEFAYRLRLSAPRPDFDLVVSPSSINIAPGRATPVRVTAVRRDGFAGAIDVAFAVPAPGFVLAGARIPAGSNSTRMTIAVPGDTPDGPVVLRFEGRARIGDADVVRAATAADDRMQAFAYHHLVPAQESMAVVLGPRRRLGNVVVSPRPTPAVVIPVGGTARVVVLATGLPGPQSLKLVLDDPPAGVVLEGWTVVPGGVELAFGAAPDAKPGAADNAIVELLVEVAPPRDAKTKDARPRTFPLGFLPAVPFEIAAR